MKNFKKLNRNELKTISGNGLLDNISGAVLEAAFGTGSEVCNVQCIINGIVTIKVLPCRFKC